MSTTANETDQDRREDVDEETAPEHRREDAGAKDSTEEPPEDSTMAPPEEGDEEAEDSTPTAARVIPRVLLALVGIAAFVWIGSEMGSGASTGATPLLVTFGGIIVGLLAGAAPFLAQRFSRHT